MDAETAAPLSQVAAAQTWVQKLRTPFPQDAVAIKPKPWCRACNNSPGKVCGDHLLINCTTCKKKITNAHLDLTYVGHAELTSRLLEVDPYWDWRPAYRDVDKDLLAGAIATGNVEIVNAVIANSPPLWDRNNNGMWMILTIHDDEGNPVERLGFGDAEGKSGPNAVKEVIGDGIRNAGMRFGAALDLWSRSDRAASLIEGDGETRQIRSAKRADQKDGDGQAEGGEAAEPEKDPVAQALADLALKLCSTPGMTVDKYTAATVNEARKRKKLGAMVDSPFGDQGRVRLSAVFERGRQTLVAPEPGTEAAR